MTTDTDPTPDVEFTGLSVACTAAGTVHLHLDVILLDSGDRFLSPDTADALASALSARAVEARLMLDAEARRLAEAEHREVERLVSHIPLAVPPETAREAARAILAAFDVTPKDEGGPRP